MGKGTVSAGGTELGERVLRLVHRKKTCSTEILLKACASYPWNEVFLEIDRLSRSGKVRLFYQQDGDYAVRLPPAS
jgi:hypothetical protein